MDLRSNSRGNDETKDNTVSREEEKAHMWTSFNLLCIAPKESYHQDFDAV